MSGQISTPGCLPVGRRDEIGVASAVGGLDRNVAPLDRRGVGRDRHHRHQPGDARQRPELPPRGMHAGEEAVVIVGGLFVAHRCLSHASRPPAILESKPSLEPPRHRQTPSSPVSRTARPSTSSRRKCAIASPVAMPSMSCPIARRNRRPKQSTTRRGSAATNASSSSSRSRCSRSIASSRVCSPVNGSPCPGSVSTSARHLALQLGDRGEPFAQRVGLRLGDPDRHVGADPRQHLVARDEHARAPRRAGRHVPGCAPTRRSRASRARRSRSSRRRSSGGTTSASAARSARNWPSHAAPRSRSARPTSPRRGDSR